MKQLTLILLSIIVSGSLISAKMKESTNTTTSGSKTLKLKDASTIPTLYLSYGNNKIAYRTLGKGTPMILCNRFRGTLDTWDPAFLNALAVNNKIIIFDYPGIGASSGQLPHSILDVAKTVDGIASSLKLDKFNLLGWSYGGAVAQTYAANSPAKIDRLILIGANPPGKNEHPLEKAFTDAAFKPVNDLKDEEVLFFEPNVPASVAAAKLSHDRIALRKTDLSTPVSPDKFGDYFKGVADYQQDDYRSREKLGSANFPILILMGDHDPSCPVENWYPIVRKWKSAQLHVIGSSGHGVQHEFPEYSVKLINLFLGGYKG